MSIHRRKLLCAAAAALWLPVLASTATPAHAADWPTRPVRLIVAYPPGGATDVQARLVAQRLSEQWKQPVIVENRPGGNTVIATNVVAQAEPDGHTLLLTAMPFALNPLPTIRRATSRPSRCSPPSPTCSSRRPTPASRTCPS